MEDGQRNSRNDAKIEMAGRSHVASYEDQVQDLRQQLGDHLQEVAASYDKETAKLVPERVESSKATIASLKQTWQ